MKIALATPGAASTVQPDYRRKPRRASPTLQSNALGHDFMSRYLRFCPRGIGFQKLLIGR